MYSMNFIKVNTKFCLSLHYNGANNYLFVNGTEIHKFTAKDFVDYNSIDINHIKDIHKYLMKKSDIV